jgi:hypothetical protein
MRLEWTIIAQSHAVDRASNALSIFNILETINVPAAAPDPSSGTQAGLPLPFSVIQLWSRGIESGPEQAEARVRIVAPNGTQLVVVPMTVNFAAGPRVRTILNAPAFPYAGLGEYRFETETREGEEWKPISVTTIVLAKADPTQPAQPV